jgi:hypothetical protein
MSKRVKEIEAQLRVSKVPLLVLHALRCRMSRSAVPPVRRFGHHVKRRATSAHGFMSRIARVAQLVAAAAIVALPAVGHAQNRYAFDGVNGGFAPADGRARLYWTLGTSSAYNNSTARGSYLSTGAFGGTTSPVTGLVGGTESRGFYLFDFSIIGGRTSLAMTAATLNIDICLAAFSSCGVDGYVSPNPAETIDVWDVTGTTSGIAAGTGGLAAFTDLGSGTKFGSAVISSSSKGTTLSISLNSDGLSALTTAYKNSGIFALGTALGPLPEQTAAPTTPTSPSTTVPEPSTWAMLATGLAMIGWRSRRTKEPNFGA